jgi:hypothetical protein
MEICRDVAKNWGEITFSFQLKFQFLFDWSPLTLKFPRQQSPILCAIKPVIYSTLLLITQNPNT